MAEDTSTLSSLIHMIQEVEDRTSMSLTQYTRKVTINSRTFIENTLRTEPVLTPLMENIMNLYCGLILTAVNMNTYITSTTRVRDMMSIVATEGLTAKKVSDGLKNYFAGLEEYTMFGVKNEDPDVEDRQELDLKSDRSPMYNVTGSSSQVDLKTDTPIPSGRILKIGMGVGKNKIDVNMLVQLQPTLIPPEVCGQFIALNFTPSLSQRYLQAKAGEISTFKDLIMGLDLRRARYKALKKDKEGVLTDMLDRQENSLVDAWLKLFQVIPNKQNIANSILVFDKQHFDIEASRAGLRVKDYRSRQTFLNKTFAMMIALVDTMYNNVELYYHGVPTKSEFSFDQLKKNSKYDSTDLVSIMKNYASGVAPKF